MLSVDIAEISSETIPAIIVVLTAALVIKRAIDNLGWRERMKADIDLADRLAANPMSDDETRVARLLRLDVANRILQRMESVKTAKATLADTVEAPFFTALLTLSGILTAFQGMVFEGVEPSSVKPFVVLCSLLGLGIDLVQSAARFIYRRIERRRRAKNKTCAPPPMSHTDAEMERMYREIMALPVEDSTEKAEEEVDPEECSRDRDEDVVKE